MKFISRTGAVLIALGVAVCLACTAAWATPFTYVGNDPNGTTTALSSWPNSTAAFNDFISGLSSDESNNLVARFNQFERIG